MLFFLSEYFESIMILVTATADLKINFPEGIPKSGADALRFALLRHDVLSMDIPVNVAELVDEVCIIHSIIF